MCENVIYTSSCQIWRNREIYVYFQIVLIFYEKGFYFYIFILIVMTKLFPFFTFYTNFVNLMQLMKWTKMYLTKQERQKKNSKIQNISICEKYKVRKQ